MALVPLTWWLSAHGDWAYASWLVPVLVLVSLLGGVLLGRQGVVAAGPVLLTTIAVFSVAMTVATTALYAVDNVLLRVLLAAVVVVPLAAFGGPGIQQAAADVNGEWIVAVGVAVLALFATMMLLKVQVSLHHLHDDKPETAQTSDPRGG